MKIRITKRCTYEIGEVIDLPDFQARELIDQGVAVLWLVRGFTEDTKSKQSFEKAVTK